MKYINRIIYAALLALILMIILSLVMDRTLKSQLYKQGLESYNKGTYEGFLPTRYYGKDFIIEEEFETDGEKFKLIGYEVIGIYADQANSYVKDQGIFFLIVGNDETKKKTFDMQLFAGPKTNDENELEYIIEIDYKYEVISKEIPVFVSNQVAQATYFNSFMFTKDKIEYKLDKIIIDEEITIEINFGKEDYTLKTYMEDYITTNGDIPRESTALINYSGGIVINSMRNIFYAIGIFIVVVIPMTYFIFRPKKKLGSKDPTIGVSQDIDKLK